MQVYLWVSTGIFGTAGLVSVVWFLCFLWRRARSEPRESGFLRLAIIMTSIFAFTAATVTVALIHAYTS